MLPRESLKDLLSRKDFSRQDKLLLCLAVDMSSAKAVKDIKSLATGAGLRSTKDWNVSAILKASNGLAVRTDAGWELTTAGTEHVARLAGPLLGAPTAAVASSLRSHLPQIVDPTTAAFVEEAIRCLEGRLYRAAVVFSWIGALSVLQEHVVQNCLAAFNAEARRRDAKWKDARTRDDLSRMKEYDFLQVLESISVIGKSVKQALENCLQLRNGCGHPNSLQVADSTASAHVEVLMLNVFSKFKA